MGGGTTRWESEPTSATSNASQDLTRIGGEIDSLGDRNQGHNSSTRSAQKNLERLGDDITVEEWNVEETADDRDLEETLGEHLEGIRRAHGRDCAVPGSRGPCRAQGQDITKGQATEVRRLLFGNPLKTFDGSWLRQGFFFNRHKALGYGVVQLEGGPCGVLAAVQAFLLQHLLYGGEAGCDWQAPSRAQQERALVFALSEIIWRAGRGKAAILVLATCDYFIHKSSQYKPDGVTERVQLHHLTCRGDLENMVEKNIDQFTQEKGYGVILLVYSCVFSRGLEKVRVDMDQCCGEVPTLMARHGYASQELVNLLILGCAHSNLFDGQSVMRDGDGGEDTVVLKGVSTRGRVGFLTLFEAYNYMEVGKNLKSPETPLWVVCSESHYSVLFSATRRLSPFDLFYYDQLGGQDEVGG
ncbi:unnamed protein product, partial [Discosporangium mesarthrocarpum]